MSERRRWSPVPRSLLGRMLLLTLLAVLVAQGLSSLFWLSHLRSSQREGLFTSSRSLAYSMAASVSYFRSLPLGYRPLVLDQLRSMGGTRFFVSLNDRPLEMRALPDTPNKQAVLEIVQDVLHQRLGKEVELQVEFVSPDELRLFNGALKLDELPRSWAHYALTLEPVNPPVLVTQIRIGESEWLYIASLMPAPYVSLEPEGLQPQQVLDRFHQPVAAAFHRFADALAEPSAQAPGARRPRPGPGQSVGSAGGARRQRTGGGGARLQHHA